jgi:hypothetical protein
MSRNPPISVTIPTVMGASVLAMECYETAAMDWRAISRSSFVGITHT